MKEESSLDYSVPFILNIIGGIFIGVSILCFLFPDAWGDFAFLAPQSWAGDSKSLSLVGFGFLLFSFVVRILIDIRWRLKDSTGKNTI